MVVAIPRKSMSLQIWMHGAQKIQTQNQLQIRYPSVSFGLAFNLPQMSASVSEVMLSQKDEASWSKKSEAKSINVIQVRLGALKIK